MINSATCGSFVCKYSIRLFKMNFWGFFSDFFEQLRATSEQFGRKIDFNLNQNAYNDTKFPFVQKVEKSNIEHRFLISILIDFWKCLWFMATPFRYEGHHCVAFGYFKHFENPSWPHSSIVICTLNRRDTTWTNRGEKWAVN